MSTVPGPQAYTNEHNCPHPGHLCEKFSFTPLLDRAMVRVRIEQDIYHLFGPKATSCG